jgi:hypothetical protein
VSKPKKPLTDAEVELASLRMQNERHRRELIALLSRMTGSKVCEDFDIIKVMSFLEARVTSLLNTGATDAAEARRLTERVRELEAEVANIFAVQYNVDKDTVGQTAHWRNLYFNLVAAMSTCGLKVKDILDKASAKKPYHYAPPPPPPPIKFG